MCTLSQPGAGMLRRRLALFINLKTSARSAFRLIVTDCAASRRRRRRPPPAASMAMTDATARRPDVDTIIGRQGETFGNFTSRVLSEHH